MYNKKSSRNSPCWCGSQKKYKKCHMNRDKQEPMKPWDTSKQFDTAFSKKLCSSPESFHHECSGQIVKAHTVPKSTSLKAIAEDGHVLGFRMTMDAIRRNKGRPKLEKIGINKASTFNGFCSKHDDLFFGPVEKSTFENTPEQCFLLSYRSFAREYYTKLSALETKSLMKQVDKGRDLDEQFRIQELAFFSEIGEMLSLRDLEYHKKYYDRSLETKSFSNIRAVVFSFDAPPPIMTSGSVNPDFDFNGKPVQDLSDFNLITDLMSVTSFYDGAKGKIVFSWLEHCHGACSAVVTTLLQKSRDKLPVFLVQYIVKNFENTFYSPSWWQSIDLDSQKNLLSLMGDGVNLHTDLSSYGLTNEMIKIEFPEIESIDFVNWNFETRAPTNPGKVVMSTHACIEK